MDRTSRSLKVNPNLIDRVKLAFTRTDCLNQKDLAEELELNPDTVNRFLNGHPVDRANAQAICERLSIETVDMCIPGNASVDDLAHLETAAAGSLTEVPENEACHDSGEHSEKSETLTEKPTSTVRVQQDVGTNSGFMFGQVKQANISQSNEQPANQAPEDSPADEPVAPSESVEVNQSAALNTGFMFGQVNQANIPNP